MDRLTGVTGGNMSENETPQGSEAQDPIKNLKSEMERKLGNTSDQLAKLAQQNAELTKYVQSLMKPTTATPAAEEDIESLWFSKPAQVAQKIKEEATRDAMRAMSAKTDATNKVNQVIAEVVRQFPEASDVNSEFSKKTAEIYQKLVGEYGDNPALIKTAAYEAAQQLQLSSGRRGQDTFSLGNSSSTSPQRSGQKQPDLAKETIEFAQIMGLDVSNPDVVKRLKEKSQRNWTRYS